MRAIVTGLSGFLAVGCVGLACADPPSTSAAAPTPAAAPASAPAAPVASESAAPAAAKTGAENSSATAQKATTSRAQLTPQERDLVVAGYKPQMQNGQKMWCREQISTGTRLSRGAQCNTADELEQRTKNGRRILERAQGNMLDCGKNCGG